MTALTERWGYNEPEITSEEIEQRADFLMTHGSVPIKLVHLIVEGKTEIAYWDRMALGTGIFTSLLFFKAPLVRKLTAFPRIGVAGVIGYGAWRILHAFSEDMWQKRVNYCYKKYVMAKNLHPNKTI